MGSDANKLTATFETKEESLSQELCIDGELPSREVRAETSNKPNLLPNNVIEIDPDVGLYKV